MIYWLTVSRLISNTICGGVNMVDLKYELIGASKLSSHTDVPVVITLHGIGSNYLDLRPLISIFDQQVIELHLQGSVPYANGYAYYFPEFHQRSEAEVIESAAQKIYEQTQEILKSNHLEDHPLAVIGFSQGAILATVLMAFHPKWLQAALVLSGKLPDFLSDWAKQHLKLQEVATAVFISQGNKDSIVSLDMGRQLAKFFKTYTNSSVYHEYNVGHSVSRQMIQDAYEWETKLNWSKKE